MILFKHVDEKGVFQAFYASKLSQRLLDNISISHEAEVSMISKLTEACGLEYTLNLRRMLYGSPLLLYNQALILQQM